uniref:Uncharacterized protein n=1 Tax=Alexandrium monilatum TaxID=311494 RepID=A0A7S4UAT7_9DINO
MVPRVWRYLEAPADIPCCAACAAWHRAAHAEAAQSSRVEPSEAARDAELPRPLLRLPHMGFSNWAAAEAALGWMHGHVSPATLETLRLPPFPPQGVGFAGVPREKDYEDCEGSALTAALRGWAGIGAVEWVAWLLAAELTKITPEVPEGTHQVQSDQPPCGWLCRRAPGAASTQHGQATPPPFVALRVASASGHAAVIRELLRARADVHTTDENECTALHWAADKGRAEACRVLLEGRCEVNHQDDDQWTPLCLAADDGHVEVCRVLLEARAWVNLPDEDLKSAERRGHSSLIALLLEHGADPAQGDQDGVTPQGLLSAGVGGMARSSGGGLPQGENTGQGSGS